MKNKKLFITGIVIFSAVVVLATFLLLWYWGDTYPQFDGTFDSEFEIPGLADGACPQGIANWKTDAFKVETDNGDGTKTTVDYAGDEYFFISSYFKGEPSRIYVVGKTEGYVGYVTMKNVGGEGYYDGHCGGVATNGYFLWVCSTEGDDGYVYCAKTTDKTYDYKIGREIIAKAHGNGEISFTAKFNSNGRAAFLYYYRDERYHESYNELQGDKLYVGEFSRGNAYKTDESHHGTTNSGETNKAFVFEYSVNTSTTMTNESNVTGLNCVYSDRLPASFSNRVPQVQNIYSIPDEIQGFARIHKTKEVTNSGGGVTVELEDKLVLSQSYGLKNSKLYFYDWTKITNSSNYKTYRNFNKDEKYFEYKGVTTTTGAAATENNLNLSSLRVYFIDNGADESGEKRLLNEYSIPSMSEGLCVSGDRVYVLFESGANKYRLFVRRVLRNVYSFVPRENLSGK